MPLHFHHCGYSINVDYGLRRMPSHFYDGLTNEELPSYIKRGNFLITCPGCGAEIRRMVDLLLDPPPPCVQSSIDLAPGCLYTVRGYVIRIYVDSDGALHIGSPPGTRSYRLEGNSHLIIR